MFDKIPLPKHIAMIVIGLIFAIMVGGYGLYFSSKKQIAQKDREFEILREKTMHAEENFNDLKKKFDVTSNDLTAIKKDYKVLLQKHQECKEKQDELQTKRDELQLNNERLKANLREAQIKLGLTPEDSTSESVHPVQLLNKDKQPSSGTTDSVAKSIPSGLSCPSSDNVSKNVPAGTWKDNNITWWVDFTSRPLFDKETVKDLFKMLYDGNSIACYYALTNNDDNNIWMVIKTDVKNSKNFKLSEKGWSLCPTEECKSICEKDNLKECSFTTE